MGSTRIIKAVNEIDYLELIENYKDKITVNPHANFRVSEAQRKVYKDEYLISILEGEKPRFVGMQQNGNYAAFFSRKEGFLRLIFAVNTLANNIEIVTFFIADNIPEI